MSQERAVYSIPPPLAPTGLEPTDILNGLKAATPQEEGYQQMLHTMYHFASFFHDTSEKPMRGNKIDRTVTHPLYTAYYLAILGMTDIDLLRGAIGHDLIEDTAATLEDVRKNSNDTTTNFVQIMTIDIPKSQKLNVATDLVPDGVKQKKWAKERLAFEGILSAIHKGPGALFIKLSDFYHNDLTGASLSIEAQKKRANLALEFYGPLARRLGAIHFARTIEDDALRILQPRAAQTIEQFIDKTVSDTFIAELFADMDALEKNMSSKPEETDPSSYYSSIQIEQPSLYEIYKKIGAKTDNLKPESVYPTVKIICPSESSQLLIWYKNLLQEGILNGEESDPISDMVKGNSIKRRLFIPALNVYVNAELTTDAIATMPIDLYTDPDNLTEEQRESATNKLQLLEDVYTQALDKMSEKGGTETTVRENLTRETIEVYTPTGSERYLPQGATILDFAYAVGPKLGNEAVGGHIKRPGQPVIETKNLLFRLEPGDEIEILTSAFSVVLPSRYDLVTTTSALNQIKTSLKKNAETETVETDARNRGKQILLWLYEKKYNKKLRIPVDFGFDRSLNDRYKQIDDLICRIGMIPLPATDNFYNDWNNKKLPLHTTHLKAADELISNLEEIRKETKFIQIQVSDEPGIHAKISDIIDKYGISMLPFIAQANHKSTDHHGVVIYIGLPTLSEENAETVFFDVKKSFLDGKVSLISADETNLD